MARHVQIHFRFPPGFDRLNGFLAKLRTVFGHYQSSHGIDITFDAASAEAHQTLGDPVRTGTCTLGPTPEATAAFETCAPGGMGEDDIAVLFPVGLDGSSRFGCAQCPVGLRGVMVSADAPELTLAHEIGHLFLGTDHSVSKTNLMFGDPERVQEDPPLLTTTQIERLRESDWALPQAFAIATASVRSRRKPARPEPPRHGPPEGRRKSKKKSPKRRRKTPPAKARRTHATTEAAKKVPKGTTATRRGRRGPRAGSRSSRGPAPGGGRGPR